MRKQLRRYKVVTFKGSNVGMWMVLVALLIVGIGTSAVAAASNVQTLKHSNIQTAPTKWDAGQKDLLASMEDEAARRPLSSEESGAKDEPVYVTLLSFIFKLAVVVALAYGTIYVLKRFNVSTLRRSSVAGIRVVENTSLGANRSLHVVEVGGKRLLVASTPSQVNLLTELEADECGTQNGDPAPDSTIGSPKSAFKDQLSTFMGAKPDTGDAAANVAQLIRGSGAFLQEKVVELGRLRKKFRDA